MTNTSMPQQGKHDPATPLLLPDSGPYSANEWAAILATLQRAGVVLSTTGPLQVDTAFNDVGVFYAVDNQLEVTSAGANTINIDTGAAMVAGRVAPVDTALVFTVPSNRTNDLIVVRQNWTGATYVPPASVDADEEVPPDTARVTRVASLVNDATLATYWDIPLADFTTNGAGAVTLNSDDRVWVDAMTQRVFIAPLLGYNLTTPAVVSIGYTNTYGPSVELEDGETVYAEAFTTVPRNYISSMVCTGIILNCNGGNGVFENRAWAGECSEAYDTHPSTTGSLTEAVTANTDEYSCNADLAIANIGIEDILRLRFERTGGAPGDTANIDLAFIGWNIEYFGWGRR